jgi:hypothetical protein
MISVDAGIDNKKTDDGVKEGFNPAIDVTFSRLGCIS